MATGVSGREPIAAAESERAAIAGIATILQSPPRTAKLVGPDGTEIDLPASLFDILDRAVTGLIDGEAVAIVPIHQELTTQQAANILNVSRQYFVTLLDGGKIRFSKTGTHRRIKFGDLMAYKEHRDTKRREGLDALTRMSEEMGLYDVEPGGVGCRRSEPS